MRACCNARLSDLEQEGARTAPTGTGCVGAAALIDGQKGGVARQHGQQLQQLQDEVRQQRLGVAQVGCQQDLPGRTAALGRARRATC